MLGESERILLVSEKLSQYQNKRRVPAETKAEVAELLKENSYSFLQKRFGICYKTLKSWEQEYSFEQTFIPLPEVKKNESVKLDLKLSRSINDTWSVEGNLSLVDWQRMINLLEGIR